MINNFDDLWSKMQIEFNKINKRFAEIDERFTEIDEKFTNLENRTEEKFGNLENKIEEGFAKADKRFENLENKIDIVTNVNLAQILNEQTRTRNEITKKLDEYIIKNEFEHKRFDYKLAELEMKFGYTAK